MRAFHGQRAIKDFYTARVRGHQRLDQHRHGQYVNGEDPDSPAFKGCAVGCCLHSGNHAAGEVEIGYPQLLMRLLDGIFEALPHGDDSEFACQFLEVVKPGADLSGVWPRFAHWLLVDDSHGVLQYAKTDRARTESNRVAALYSRQIAGEEINEKEWRAAANASYDAAAEAAADAATYAADAATYAANAATYGASAGAYAASFATDAAAAAACGRLTARRAQVEKLLELMGDAPVLEADNDKN